MWVFDSSIRTIYDEHVQQHIPNYNKVIDKSLDICKAMCAPNDAIIDVGCANGVTLNKLHNLGFRNLHGVESSADMIQGFDPCKATITISESLPVNKYKVIIANWVLHFVVDKAGYIKDIYDNLTPSGVAIVSNKTSTDPLFLNFYHQYKLSQGVSKQQVLEKSEQLKGVMFVESADWYLTQFKLYDFSQIEIIDADWCFTTFFLKK
jgi:trans-aconitate methyltransferase